jgi:hypothetical protein
MDDVEPNKKKVGLYAAYIWVCSTMAVLIVNKTGNVVYVYLILQCGVRLLNTAMWCTFT